MRTHLNRISILFLLLLVILTVAIISGRVLLQGDGTKMPVLETPESGCAAQPASWQGIIPGESTQDDVIHILGEPAEILNKDRSGRKIFLYQPVVVDLDVKLGNAIAFGEKDIVEWIDIWDPKVTNGFSHVADYAQQYGSSLDQVYLQSVADVAGPTRVYVWSNCGLALTTLLGISDDSSSQPDSSEPTRVSMPLEFRYPSSPSDLYLETSGLDAVLRLFIFRPTNFAAFQKYYSEWIPDLHLYYRYLDALQALH